MARQICSVENCTSFVKGRGFCNKHYFREFRAGRQPGPNRTERVLSFIESCIVANTDKCLDPPFKSRSDYPSFVHHGVFKKLGWVVLERTEGSRPSGLEMRHLCGNRRCCNPRHLTWGTHLENMQDWKDHGCAGDRTGVNNPNYRHGRYSKES